MIGVLAAMSRVAGQQLYVDDVFSAYTYTGNGATQTITNGIDLAGKGGMVWIKGRSGATDHQLFDTARAATYELISNSTAAQVADADTLTAFNSTGFDLGADATTNTNAATYVSWTFRKAAKFFDVVTYTGDGSQQTLSHALGIAPGMMIVKRTDSAGGWFAYHRSGNASSGGSQNTRFLLQATDAQSYETNDWASTAPTSTQFTVGNASGSGNTSTNISGATYVAYLFAHDTSAEGIIQCGTFTTDGSGNTTVTLGWEPQFCIIKGQDVISDWFMLDQSRAWVATASLDYSLSANTALAEVTTANYGSPTSTGFTVAGMTASKIYIYCVIRRPNKPPTVGTQVYNSASFTGVGGLQTAGFPVDLVFEGKNIATTTEWVWMDRQRGGTKYLESNAANAESLGAGVFDSMTRVMASSDGNNYKRSYQMFRRAPGVHDQICTTGTGANKTEAHNLTVAPELWLHKGRSGATEWVWGSSLLANTQKIVMPSPNGVVTDATAWNSTYPTSTVFSLGTAAAVNTNAATYVTYLWATLAGVSKVGTYTGNGSNQTINCGFSTGARFVLIIRTTASTAQDIFIWDTVRGIIAGNDPHLSLNTTAAEVTTDDSIDPDTSGFVVNQVAATNINVTSAVYIFLAIA